MQDYPDDPERRDQQVVAVPTALPVARWSHGYQLHGHLGNHHNPNQMAFNILMRRAQFWSQK